MAQYRISVGARATHHDDVYEGPAFVMSSGNQQTVVRTRISGLLRVQLPDHSDKQLDEALGKLFLPKITEFVTGADVSIAAVSDEDVAPLSQLLVGTPKNCTERTDTGSRLQCSASGGGLVSLPTCLGCDRPDDSLLCEHFRNPHLMSYTDASSLSDKKQLIGADCAAGKSPAGAGCTPWGNDCWSQHVERADLERGSLSPTWSPAYELDGAPIYELGSAYVVPVRSGEGELRMLKAARSNDVVTRLRFEREIEVLESIDHPNVMPIYASCAEELWYVMPRADARALNPNPDFSRYELSALIQQIAAGVKAGHANGFVHRDLKPNNILLHEGNLVVADWGIARNPTGTTRSLQPTASDLPMGTEGWAAPEQNSGAHDVGPAADVYSLGQLIGWLLTGIHPQQNVPLIPKGLGPWDSIVEQMTKLEPDERPASVDSVMALIQDSLELEAGRGDLMAAAFQVATDDRPLPISVTEPSRGYFRVELLPNRTVTYIPDFERYSQYLSQKPTEARSTFNQPPPKPFIEWSRTEFQKYIDGSAN